jgi:hypothetical protein
MIRQSRRQVPISNVLAVVRARAALRRAWCRFRLGPPVPGVGSLFGG